jgi:diacylglycerol kinase (ATP)
VSDAECARIISDDAEEVTAIQHGGDFPPADRSAQPGGGTFVATFLRAMNRTVQIVVTPGSGEGRAMTTARALRKLLEGRGATTNIRTYTNLAALARWARTCDADFTHLICVGGDATQSTAATAAVRLGVPFVPVPSGFGNIFARSFGHPDRAEAVAELLETGAVLRVDVGLVDDEEIFLCHHSYGPLQQIQDTVEKGRAQPKSRIARYFAYWGMAKRFLVDMRPPSLRVEIDGARVAEDAALVTVANVETYRGFLSLTPTASPVDGLFDVFIVPRTTRLRLATLLVRLMLKVPGRSDDARLLRGRRVAVTVNGRRREELRAVRGALPLLVPPGTIERLALTAHSETRAG